MLAGDPTVAYAMKAIPDHLAARSPRWTQRERRELLITCICVGLGCVMVAVAILYLNGNPLGGIQGNPLVPLATFR